MEYKTLESVKYIELNSKKQANQTTIVLFHGYGANAKDIMSIKNFISSDKKYRWIFPEGLFDTPLGGRSWFAIDEKIVHQISVDKNYERLAFVHLPSLEQSIFKVNAFLKSLKTNQHQLILGGFSQGSLLAFNLAFYKKIKPKALMLFSSLLIHKDKLSEMATSCKGIPFVQSHGKQDEILSYENGHKLYQFLIKCGLKGEFMSFEGGHHIPVNILKKTGLFLSQL